MEVLNPILFNALVRVFKNVKIYNRGDRGNYTVTYDTYTWNIQNIARQWGETYAVCCPFCNDKKFHLYFSHRFGFRDPITKSLYKRTVWCFHNCLEKNSERIKQLYRMLFSQQEPLYFSEDVVKSITDINSDNPFELCERFFLGDNKSCDYVDLFSKLPSITWPGKCVPLSCLTDEHPAIVYLKARGFDVDELNRIWKVRFCVDSRNKLLKNRIIIPIYFQDKMVGYQARKVGEPTDNEPKYYFSTGFPKSLIWYNVERATDHEVVVIVEGVTDVWKIGENATAIFGLRANPEAINLFMSLLYEKHRNQATVCVALDPDLPPNTKPQQHQIHVLIRQLESNFYKIKNIVPVWLPSGTDPGSLERSQLQKYIEEAIDVYKTESTTARKPIKHLPVSSSLTSV